MMSLVEIAAKYGRMVIAVDKGYNVERVDLLPDADSLALLQEGKTTYPGFNVTLENRNLDLRHEDWK